MRYNLDIPQHNIKPHLDIEKDIQTQKNGLMTFTIRVNQGNIEDYVRYETITAARYSGFSFTTITQHITTRGAGSGGQENGIRDNDG